MDEDNKRFTAIDKAVEFLMNDTVSVNRASKMLKMHRRTLYRLIELKRLKSLMTYKGLRIRKEDIERMAMSQTRKDKHNRTHRTVSR
jgi:excisionase family DNA binding protein